MSSHEKTFKTACKQRNTYAVSSIVTLLFLIAGAMLTVKDPIQNLTHFKEWKSTDKVYLNVLSQVWVGTSASVLAACLIEFFSVTRNIQIKKEKMNSFGFFFNCDPDQGKVAIVMPKYDNQVVCNLLETQEVRQMESEDAPNFDLLKKFAISADKNLLSFSDTQAALNIELLFQMNDFDRPELRFDDESLHINDYNTLFIVGLHSNSFLLKTIGENSLFSLTDSGNFRSKFKIADISTEGVIQSLEASPLEYADDEIREYGLIARLTIKSKNVFIVGGNNANMTSKCSLYLLKNWKKIEVKAQAFAICIKRNKQSKSDYLIEEYKLLT